jgi:threonyl-tRNA synthetase
MTLKTEQYPFIHREISPICAVAPIFLTQDILRLSSCLPLQVHTGGDEKNKQLTRIYGVSFPKQKLLDEHLAMLEQAKERDHRKIGRELELFTFSQKVGSGLPLWLPKGAQLRERLENFLRKVQREYGYEQVITPHIGQKELYVTSGHYANMVNLHSGP